MSAAPRKGLFVLLSALVCVASPFAVHLVLRLAYLRKYHGLCGPHAPDIAAHPCSYATYASEFSAGFAGVGLLCVQCLAFVLTVLLVLAAWLTWALVQRLGARRPLSR